MVPTRSYTASNKLCFLIASIYHDHQVCMRRGGADDRLAARSKVAGQPMSFLRSRNVSLLDSTLTRTYTVRESCASITQLGRYLICEAAGRTAEVSLDGMQTNAIRLERWSMPTASWLRGRRSGRRGRCHELRRSTTRGSGQRLHFTFAVLPKKAALCRAPLTLERPPLHPCC